MSRQVESDIGVALLAVYRLLRLKLVVTKHEKSRPVLCRGCECRIATGQEVVEVHSGRDWYGHFCRLSCCEDYFTRFILDLDIVSALQPDPGPNVPGPDSDASAVSAQSVVSREQTG
jgi:hypothetical protein